MKKVIIVTGHHASLKTTVSRQLGSDLGIMVYHLEEMKEIIKGLEVLESEGRHSYYRRLALKLIENLIIDTLNVQDSVMLEMFYVDAYYHQIIELCKKMNFETVTLFLTGDPEALYARYSKRAPYGVMNKKALRVLDLLEFKDTMEAINPIDRHGNTIEVDTTNFDDHDYRILMHQLIDKLEWKLNDLKL